MPTTQIHVTAADNEIMLIACTPSESVELLHYKSGFNKPVDVMVFPGAILPTGQYSLVMIGVNWGGPSKFTIQVTTNGQTQTFNGSAPGVGVWHQTIHMDIVAGQ